MRTLAALGALELSSVGIGYLAEDQMLKAADVELLIARTICSGKYLVIVAGSVSDVEAAVSSGLAAAGESVIDVLVLPRVHEAVLPALGQSVALSAAQAQALGVLESYSGVSILAAADAAAKAANVILFHIHVAMALGGKGLCLFTGSVADCEAAVRAGADKVRERGLLVSEIVIAGPRPELFREYL
ncbi:MAG: BMC domain-containing protein [Candidatus Schekmanbacteria bacterium]|nr:BMC domain-containing protein [Candidatus Schekmanbacteria bacterium]